MKILKLSKEELKQLIDEGRAHRIHLYESKNMLMPRGSMKKESIGLYLLDRIKDAYEDWTDPKYGDNPPKQEVIETLFTNLINEAYAAWDEFIGEIKK
jgi:hypothetical protein